MKNKGTQILLIGDGAVGKTSIIKRYNNVDIGMDHLATVGLDFMIKKYQRNGQEHKVQIWDTAGQDRVRTMTAGFY